MNYPLVVLVVSLLEVDHPVAECFERGRCHATPDVRYQTVVQRPGDVVQLMAHANLARQRLRMSYM